MDADFEPNTKIWCNRNCPDEGMVCSRTRHHAGQHAAHWVSSLPEEHGRAQYRWSDGDTVSVKAGTVQHQRVPVLGAQTTPPVTGQISPFYKIKVGFDEKPKTPTAKELNELQDRAAKALTARSDLAADLLPRVLELGPAFRGDRMLFMKWEEIIRTLKREAKP